MYTLRLVSSLVTCFGPHNLLFVEKRPTRIVEVSDKRFVIAGAIYRAISGNIQEGAATVGADLIFDRWLDALSRWRLPAIQCGQLGKSVLSSPICSGSP
jgi:hypothetical protein